MGCDNPVPPSLPKKLKALPSNSYLIRTGTHIPKLTALQSEYHREEGRIYMPGAFRNVNGNVLGSLLG